VRGRKENPCSVSPADRRFAKMDRCGSSLGKSQKAAPRGKRSGFCGVFKKNDAFHGKNHYGSLSHLAVQFGAAVV
jgi:hypothetical protein